MPERDHGGNVQELAATRGADWRTLVDFSASINPLGPPAEVSQLICEHRDLVACYPPNYNAALLSALAGYCGSSSEHLLVGNGATELIYFLLRFFKSRRALVALPTFSEFPRACIATGVAMCAIRFIAAGTRGWRIDWKSLERFLTSGTWDLLILVNPNNPTGATLDPGESERLLQLTRARGVTVLLDESFIDFVPDQSWIGALRQHDHLVVLRSLTKFFAIPGLRLGYLAASPDVIRRMRVAREPWQVNQFAQLAAERCVGLVGYHDATRGLVRRERAALAKRLASVRGLTPYPSRANFMLVHVDPGCGSVGALYDRLLSRGIVIRRCDWWPGVRENCFRVAVRSRADNQRLVDELRTWVCAS